MLIRAITRVNLSVAREREMLKGMSEHLQKDQQLLERLDELLKRYEAGDEPLHEAFTADEVAAARSRILPNPLKAREDILGDS